MSPQILQYDISLFSRPHPIQPNAKSHASSPLQQFMLVNDSNGSSKAPKMNEFFLASFSSDNNNNNWENQQQRQLGESIETA